MKNGLLNNGATVLKSAESIVLALFRGEYVTWYVDKRGFAHFGHYFGACYSDAVHDFNARVRNAAG